MKKNLILLFAGIALFILVGSCRKAYREEIVPTPKGDLIIKASGDKMVMINDTNNAEINTNGNYYAEPPLGVTITFYTWTFTEPNGQVTSKTGQTTTYRFYSLGFGKVKVVGIDQNNQAHQDIQITRVVADISQLDPITNWPSIFLSSGIWQERWAINKRTTKWPGVYGYIGTVTSPQWTLINLAPADTNYLLINNNLVPVTGSNGTQISINPIVSPLGYPTHDQMGVVKNNIWGDFSGSRFVNLTNPTVIHSSLRSDGTVVPDVTGSNNGPGEIGDQVIQFIMLNDGVTVFFNNNGPAGSNIPFYIRGNPDGTWNGAMAQTVVANYPNWGKLEILYSQLPATGLLILNFGSNIAVPQYLNPNESTSDYWDGFSGALRIIIKNVNTMDKSGNIIAIRQLRSPHFMVVQN